MKEVFQRQQEEDLYYGYREDAPWTDAEMEQQYQDWLKEQKQAEAGAANTGTTNNEQHEQHK